MTYEQLFDLASQAMLHSYSPYSHFKVGACILTEDGRTFVGCNFENASYGATICAERCAAGNAIVNGQTKFMAVAIAAERCPAWPCGVCRQVLSEFACGSDMPVIVGQADCGFRVRTLGELLPEAFEERALQFNTIPKENEYNA